MLNHENLIQPSRRDVQRRFPPGTFVADDAGTIVGTVIGWCRTAPVIDKRGKIVTAMAWEVIILDRSCCLQRYHWQRMVKRMSIDEWEDWATQP